NACTVLIFFIAGLLFFVPQARRTLGAYRIPRRPAFSSHLVNAVLVNVNPPNEPEVRIWEVAPMSLPADSWVDDGLCGSYPSKTRAHHHFRLADHPALGTVQLTF
ncbi:MAG: hypothetical protein ABSD89_13725, partial [Halobacteriota archaeon]